MKEKKIGKRVFENFYSLVNGVEFFFFSRLDAFLFNFVLLKSKSEILLLQQAYNGAFYYSLNTHM